MYILQIQVGSIWIRVGQPVHNMHDLDDLLIEALDANFEARLKEI